VAARDRGTPSRLLKILGDKILGVVVKALKNARDFLQVLGTEEQLLQISDEVSLEPEWNGNVLKSLAIRSEPSTILCRGSCSNIFVIAVEILLGIGGTLSQAAYCGSSQT
jgi:hypothetical protein